MTTITMSEDASMPLAIAGISWRRPWCAASGNGLGFLERDT